MEVMMFRILLPLFVCGCVLCGEEDITKLIAENDVKLQDGARKYLVEHSKPDEDQAWKKKMKDKVSQAMIDRHDTSENSVLNQCIVDWAAGKDFKNLSDKDKLFACRMYLLYRDSNFSPFDVGQLQLPEKILDELKKQNMHQWFLDKEKK